MTGEQPERRVKKATAVIHINNKSMSLLQRKLYNILIYNACNQQIEERDIFSIEISRLIAISGKVTKNLRHIRESIEKLQTTLVQWNLNGDIKSSFKSVQLLGGVEIKDGILYYEFSRMLKPHIFHPEIYSLIRINITSMFSSKYSLALYENCVRFKDVKTTGWKTVDEWRALLGVPDEKLYAPFANMNARIVKPAVKQVNTLSDISVVAAYKREGQGKTVTHIKFDVGVRQDFILTPKQEQGSLVEPDYQSIGKRWLERIKSNQTT